LIINTVEEFRHIIITTVYCFSKVSPWRWPHQWLKHVGDHNAKIGMYRITVGLLVCHIAYGYMLLIAIFELSV